MVDSGSSWFVQVSVATVTLQAKHSLTYSQLEDIIPVFYRVSWQHFLQRNINQTVNYPKIVDKKKQSLSEKRYNFSEDL